MKRALFLDRDGVINVEKNYVYRIEDFEFTDGIFEVTQYFYERGYLLLVVTNQAGIGRGYYTEKDFQILTDWMCNEFIEKNIKIAKVYYCPYHPQFGLGKYKADSYNRKPNPGMILQAVEDYEIDLKHSILIGDKLSDIEAGKKAGVGTNILISEHYDSNSNTVPDVVYGSIKELLTNLELVGKKIGEDITLQ
jgi:D-glycero-D-manno-heptose 1,7-bisphosphate phosphatase